MSDLWSRVAARSAAALASGALEPIGTLQREIVDQGVPFGVRIMEDPGWKPRGPRRAENPFLPPDPALTVCDWGPNHALILNKFPIFADHLLLITSRFASQTAPLEREDWAAALALLQAADGLLFFNGGEVAGASQPHRHLQLVRAPIGPGAGAFPTEAALDSGALGVAVASAALPGDADEAISVSQTLHADLGLLHEQPYNLLATRRRLWIIPRTTEHFQGVSVNALGFAGSFLVRSERAADALTRAGPLAALRQTGARPAR